MELKDVAAVSGKSGLFKVLKPTKTGVILETIDENKKRLMANANSRVSILKEISIYTTTEDGSLLLEEVFQIINEKHGDKLPVSHKSDESELRSFISTIIPDYDSERVYLSDLKKLVNWYDLLYKNMPELFEKKEEVKEEPKTEAKKSTTSKKAATDKKPATKASEKKTPTKKPATKSTPKSSTAKKTTAAKTGTASKAKKKG